MTLIKLWIAIMIIIFIWCLLEDSRQSPDNDRRKDKSDKMDKFDSGIGW